MPDAKPLTRDEIVAAIAQKAWTDEDFHKEVLADANKACERLFGVAAPPGLTIRVLEDTATTVHFVLPEKPAAGALSDSELDGIAGGVQVQTRSYYNPPSFVFSIPRFP